MLRVGNDPDDGVPLPFALAGRRDAGNLDRDARPDRAGVRPVAITRRLAHQRHSVTPIHLVRRQTPTLEDRQANGREVASTDADRRQLERPAVTDRSRRRFIARPLDHIVEPRRTNLGVIDGQHRHAMGERHGVGNRGGDHARRRLERPEEVGEQLGTPVEVLVLRPIRDYLSGENVVRAEASIHPAQLDEAAHQQPGTD